jgi:hypothetical protein
MKLLKLTLLFIPLPDGFSLSTSSRIPAPVKPEVSNNYSVHTLQLPNIILISADDLGWSDIGCYGSEVQTPNLWQINWGKAG